MSNWKMREKIFAGLMFAWVIIVILWLVSILTTSNNLSQDIGPAIMGMLLCGLAPALVLSFLWWIIIARAKPFVPIHWWKWEFTPQQEINFPEVCLLCGKPIAGKIDTELHTVFTPPSVWDGTFTAAFLPTEKYPFQHTVKGVPYCTDHLKLAQDAAQRFETPQGLIRLRPDVVLTSDGKQYTGAELKAIVVTLSNPEMRALFASLNSVPEEQIG